ncbi:MAG: protein-L-isoaspartate O-methyltransferase [Gammaproteobacteria bacterium RIFCSPLOWO2_02_FULL_47_50]|nr:MAG: protein-L-isoaspartate O-methyltransferase [Gammaproteobacteria bacterium RIFCSPLOWO2_02_47_7]OGT66388.1 MAG: protein-L-isoaspartate O-methyltransferase [Gammaproteobacteria bacterium RIFCSPLOWO2_01_FULL_47_190]OGT76325.1 MAG: protein-L-isoaspartate O-methyltransferase [Gammaproteobacteria bacterium RIFCSPLOWO2_12_47_11]OGT80432.1 MAG: protein-L-isoaspartate O-methyltransferase [Gammaproteobacteria bacterium RIFCSPLOWO2_02_FULL_47_50]OGT87856.1 MAG: protein-L-isoaspartate O-methyltransf
MEKLVQYNKEAFIRMLRRQGIRDESVLKAMATVPREKFVGINLLEFAYDDSPLPIEEGQTISQPYIVALMTGALMLKPGDRVLEVGTGSGYAAAVLAEIAAEVYTIERHQSLAHQASVRLKELKYNNVHVLCGDGTLGWPENAPYDGIVVAAGGPEAPRSLIEQLTVGGRLVIPIGPSTREQTLLRITRINNNEVEFEELGAVRFVPLIGEEGWREIEEEIKPKLKTVSIAKPAPLSDLIEKSAIHIPSIDTVDLSGLMKRIGDARVVLLGEATHGTAEFYDMRARITKELIQHKGFRFVAVEADWPDAAQIDHFVRETRMEPTEEPTFARFPTWMWANMQVLEFVKWLRNYNKQFSSPDKAVGFFGLDLYSLYSSINSVINYLEEVDPELAAIARKRYGCLTPWEADPATYGAVALTGKHKGCEQEVVEMLNTLMRKRLDYAAQDGRRFLDALSNARLVKNAEQYYRIMYEGSSESWNFRDQHMFDTLKNLLDFHGPGSRAVVWEHNSHIGDAAATEMGARGEINVGNLCRKHFGDDAYLIGFGTHHGTVAAASDWGAPMEIKIVRPSHPESYERLCHDSGLNAFMLPLVDQKQRVVKELLRPRLERAIGVIYRPETEVASHYFNASLPLQFNEYIWFDETRAVDALGPEAGIGMPETFPFGL